MKIVSFSLEQTNKYFGKIDGTRFYIGSRVPYEGFKGLMNVIGQSTQRYNRFDFRNEYGFWADFIHPTAAAEGGFFHTLNTYDKARFTFSFLQYGAHVPKGDFVAYFRSILKLPLAAEYFPDLKLENNRIIRITDDGDVVLESDTSTEGLMYYLNPTLREVEDTEVIQAAKLIHWAQNDPRHRSVQIDVGIKHFKSKLVEYAQAYGLDGKPDTICLAVCDIRHQGRAKSAVIKAALQSSNPLKALLEIGEPKYHERLLVIRREINRLLDEGTLGKRKYSLAKKDFVAI
ncbi:hypothetical protein IC229_08865 [Spirosoma sp. BT702]|uniref:Uncharacterized protein n=1 Tax=Spirosoma profusum TaxID=2771354 RepID=A0A926Y2F6_9BACT|nr:hypothetical protein [Spirosoma profusum]MBD2700746.1 hypothetical protein [Spirosoma profusum]